MLKIDEIRQNNNLLNEIDWDMTPEEAVRLYLEWGNNWSGGKYVIRSKNDVSHYFMVYAWDEKPVIYLIKRNSEEAEELAKIEMPPIIQKRFLESTGNHKGVYALEGEVKNWLKKQLYNA